MSPGMRENLFNPMPSDQPCLGSVSPVSSMKSPGLPSSAGIGVNFGSSESSSALAVFACPAPELGLAKPDADAEDGAEDGAEDDPEGDADGATGGAVASAAELAGVVVASDEVPLAAAESVVAVAASAPLEPLEIVSLARAASAAAEAFAAALPDPSATRGLVSSPNAAPTTKKKATTKMAARSDTFKVRLLSTAPATSFRADDSTHSSPHARRHENNAQDSKGGRKREYRACPTVTRKTGGIIIHARPFLYSFF